MPASFDWHLCLGNVEAKNYFEPIDQESVFDILENEKTSKTFPSTIVQFGGQTAINLTKKLERKNRATKKQIAANIDSEKF